MDILICMKCGMRLAVIFGVLLLIAGCGAGSRTPQRASAASDEAGTARVEGAGGIVEFEVLSGTTNERLTAVNVEVVAFGRSRMASFEDPSGAHMAFAAPLNGVSAVRRLILPPQSPLGYNLATAAGTLDYRDLEALGQLTEDDLRTRMERGPQHHTLIYAYNPERPLALTGAALEAFAPPLRGVTVLRPAVDDGQADAAFIIVGLDEAAFDTWEHKNIDRYLAGRVGQAPSTDLQTDLTFGWAYPVFEVFPADEVIAAGEADSITLTVSWRSRYPDPPAPWSMVLSSDAAEMVAPDIESFPFGPDSPPQEVTLNIDRTGLAAGEYEARLFIQPYSDAFGLVEQTVERRISFTVGQAPPTPTAGPSTQLAFSPDQPREGDALSITAGGFAPNEAVMIELSGGPEPIRDGRPLADAEGSLSYSFDLTGVPWGTYTLRVTGVTSGVTGEAPLTVAEAVADAVVITSELNLRTGPGYSYPVVDLLASGDQLTVVGVNNDDSWLEVITSSGLQGWVDSQWVEVSVDLSTVPWNPNVPPPP